MSIDELKAAARSGQSPPTNASDAIRVLWLTHAGQWEAAHELAQGMPSPLGARLHGLLHLIEGDEWNASYWFRRAGAREHKLADWPAVWEQLAAEVLEAAAS